MVRLPAEETLMIPCLVEHGLGIEHRLLARLEHGVEATKHAHRKDDVPVLAPDEEVAEHVVRDAPDEGDDLVV
jgi:hypothetical protein